MYKEYFRLGEMPFTIAPDPRFLFMSDRHREAIAHLMYGLQGEGGIVLLTGEVGTGKTTVCRTMLEQLPENIDIAFILNPRMSVEELLQTICEEYHINVAAERSGVKAYVDAINLHLLATNAQSRRAVLIVDEAQNLDAALLEQLRLLTNLETNTRKLLQIFLIGQPELQDLLARPEMRQVAQRVVASYHLTHLSQPEVKAYVAHRLNVAGASPALFPDTLIGLLFRVSGGVPRLINLICDRSLLGTYVQGRHQVNKPTLRKAAEEILSVQRRRSSKRNRRVLAIVLMLALVLLAAALLASPPVRNTMSAWLTLLSAVNVEQPVAVQPEAAPRPVQSGLVKLKPPPPTVPLAWPDSVPRADSEALAFQSLLKLYGITLNVQSGSRDELCRQAMGHDLRCSIRRGKQQDLELFNQPVIVQLAPPGESAFYAALIALEPTAATLSIGGLERRVALDDLMRAWNGQFVVLWKAPQDFGSGFTLNQHSPAVVWLRRMMVVVDGEPDNGSDLYDAELARRVRAFQASAGIRPSGSIGPQTVTALNMRSGQPGPRLIAARKD